MNKSRHGTDGYYRCINKRGVDFAEAALESFVATDVYLSLCEITPNVKRPHGIF